MVGVVERESLYGTGNQLFIPATTYRILYSARYLSRLAMAPASPGVASRARERTLEVLGGRHGFDPSDPDVLSATWVSIRGLLQLKTYRQILASYVFTSAGLFGMVQWLPAFLIRSHEMSLSQIGLWYGPVFGSGAVLGLLTGAILAPHWVVRDRRWEFWWSALAYLLSVPLFVGLLLVAHPGWVFALLFIAIFISTSGQGPLMAGIQTVAGSQARAMAIALALAAGVAGQTLGPFLVGWFSDAWQLRFGPDSLRFAMMVPLVLLAWGVLHLYLAAGSLHEDSRD